MKKTLKSILSLTLAMILIFSLAASAFADDVETQGDEPEKEVIELTEEQMMGLVIGGITAIFTVYVLFAEM